LSQEQETAAAAADASSAAKAATGGSTEMFLDPSYVSQLLEGLEGVDKNDPAIQALLNRSQPSDKGNKKPKQGE